MCSVKIKTLLYTVRKVSNISEMLFIILGDVSVNETMVQKLENVPHNFLKLYPQKEKKLPKFRYTSFLKYIQLLFKNEHINQKSIRHKFEIILQ